MQCISHRESEPVSRSHYRFSEGGHSLQLPHIPGVLNV